MEKLIITVAIHNKMRSSYYNDNTGSDSMIYLSLRDLEI